MRHPQQIGKIFAAKIISIAGGGVGDMLMMSSEGISRHTRRRCCVTLGWMLQDGGGRYWLAQVVDGPQCAKLDVYWSWNGGA
jgi:hypothetical protein